MIWLIPFLVSLPCFPVSLPVPVTPDSLHLQKIVENTEQQVIALQKVLAESKRDAATLERALRILEKISSGIDQSLESYRGTPSYDQALLALQEKKVVERKQNQSNKRQDKGEADLTKFLEESVKANQQDIQLQVKLQKALDQAQPGFVSKIQAQAILGSWQATTRVSAQLAELQTLLSEIHNDVSGKNTKAAVSETLAVLINGLQMQNRKQKQEVMNGPK